jgi:endonuclease YncB( thermonuclease family)
MYHRRFVMIIGFVWVVPARILSWHDGDTCNADLDTGWGNQRPNTSVRLLRLYCPELRDPDTGQPQPGSYEALSHAYTIAPPGTVVRLHSKKLGRNARWTPGGQESLSRTLADIELPDGSDFADRMVADGFGSHTHDPGTGDGLGV